MNRCPVCGLQLPPEAIFCARCGVRLPGPRTAPAWWVFAIFSIGAFVAFCWALINGASLYLDPGLSNDASKRATAFLVVVFSTLLWALQIGALLGLARSRPWGRVMATLACAGWFLTCVGIPFSILVLRELWRIRASPLRVGR